MAVISIRETSDFQKVVSPAVANSVIDEVSESHIHRRHNVINSLLEKNRMENKKTERKSSSQVKSCVAVGTARLDCSGPSRLESTLET